MGKKLPLTRRLELAFQESSSESEKKTILSNLYLFCSENLENYDSFDEFYKNLTQETLFKYSNTSSNEITIKGKSLANYLIDSVILPETNTPKYRNKMIAAMQFEFKILKEYFKND